AACGGGGTGEGGHRADDPARSRGKPRGLCGAHRVSLLRPGRAHYGRDSERERGERALRMIVGIGLDVVEVGKVRELLTAQQTFEERVFTPAEREDCAARADKAEGLAARFAANDACFKALGTGWRQGVSVLDAVLRIAKQLEGAGYETWCVGGAIRDNLLKVENHDFDLTTAAPPDEVRRLFKRTVPVGIEHGTVAVLDQQNRQHEVTTFRKDIKTDGRHAVVEFGVSLMDDLARRDFTINAIAYHPIRHEWRDPFHGAEDLEHKLIRSVGDANWRFQEDYLRILRALRFSARFEFRIHPRTLEAAKANIQG